MRFVGLIHELTLQELTLVCLASLKLEPIELCCLTALGGLVRHNQPREGVPTYCLGTHPPLANSIQLSVS
jgi:hypothetical protein